MTNVEKKAIMPVLVKLGYFALKDLYVCYYFGQSFTLFMTLIDVG